jgi:hypothetical protein
MESFKGIIDFERQEEISTKDADKIRKAISEGKKLKGKINVMADGNYVSFGIEMENGTEVVNFVMDFNSLAGLCGDVGFYPEMSNEEPSEEEKKEIMEDLKDDGYKQYLEESKEDIID